MGQYLKKMERFCRETNVCDITLIYSKANGLQVNSREFDINRILNHVLDPVPTAMFNETGQLRIGNKRRTDTLPY